MLVRIVVADAIVSNYQTISIHNNDSKAIVQDLFLEYIINAGVSEIWNSFWRKIYSICQYISIVNRDIFISKYSHVAGQWSHINSLFPDGAI